MKRMVLVLDCMWYCHMGARGHVTVQQLTIRSCLQLLLSWLSDPHSPKLRPLQGLLQGVANVMTCQ